MVPPRSCVGLPFLLVPLLLLAFSACEYLQATPTALPPIETPNLIGPVAAGTTAPATPEVPVPSETAPSALPTDTQTLTPEANLTATLALSGTETPTLATGTLAAAATVSATVTPCFGTISGLVVEDANANHQADAGEPGILGAMVFLKNSSGIVGLFSTGNGQFNFPGLVAGTYTLSETPPIGYGSEDAASVDIEVSCGATVTHNFLEVPSNATATPTASPTARLTPKPQSQLDAGPRSDATGFVPFTTGPAYYLSGCGSISAPGSYYLTASLSSQWDCLQIFSDNVSLDCQGYSLNGSNGNGYGVVVHHTSLILGRPVRNIEIRNCQMSGRRYGIFVDAADNLYIHDNVTSGNYNDTDKRNYGIFLGLVEGGGIRVNDTRGALVSGNRADNQAIGIDVRQSRGVIVRSNSTNANTAWGIHFYGVVDSEISSNTSTNNIRYCTWGSGVVGPGCDAGGIMLQGGSSRNMVANNTISGSNGNGIFIKAHGEPCGDSNTLANNRIIGALYNAIELSFCQNNRLQGNEITGSLDAIWMGFARNSEIDAGNYLHDMNNHGIISWNSQDNNISSNRIVNSREALYFYSSDYQKEEFWFVPGEASDHVSRGNCLCANTIANNTEAAFHFNNSIKNQVTNNTLANNKANFVMEGNTSGNIIEGNTILGGTAERAGGGELAGFEIGPPLALTVYDTSGRMLGRPELIRALVTDRPGDAFDLRWFKFKLRASLGLPREEPGLLAGLSTWLAFFGLAV